MKRDYLNIKITFDDQPFYKKKTTPGKLKEVFEELEEKFK